jgi:hypothetical protein
VQQQNAAENPVKSYIGATLISYFLGGFGIDRFYLGYTGLGIAKLLTLGGLGIWSYIDVWLVTFGVMRQKGDPRPLEGYAANGKVMKIIMGIWLGLQLLLLPLFLLLLVFVSAPALQENSRTITVKNDLAVIQSNLATYAANNQGMYPTQLTFESSSGKFITQDILRLNPRDVTYTPLPSGCDNVAIPCVSYTLSSSTAGGKPLTVTN